MHLFAQPLSFRDTRYIKLSRPRQGLDTGRLPELKDEEHQESTVPRGELRTSLSLETQERALPCRQSFA